MSRPSIRGDKDFGDIINPHHHQPQQHQQLGGKEEDARDDALLLLLAFRDGKDVMAAEEALLHTNVDERTWAMDNV